MYPPLTPLSNVGTMLELKRMSRRIYSSINIGEEGEGERRGEGRKGEEREERIGRECDKERRERRGSENRKRGEDKVEARREGKGRHALKRAGQLRGRRQC